MPVYLPSDASLPDDHHLAITWDDGRTDRLPLDFLRAKCPCAECVDEWTGVVRVKREDFAGVGLKSLEEVGSYAFRIGWSDGHDLGLYTWKLLRRLGDG